MKTVGYDNIVDIYRYLCDEFDSTACHDNRDLLASLCQATSQADIEGVLASVPMPGNQQVAAMPRAAVGTRIIMRPGEDGGVIT